ncbi:MAG: glucose-1-phosphate adenylyltransferase subunit GlgD [Oscillospiraceae bacterium]|jgi:glucose-1-phosphate adenylyltransferase
MLKSKTMGLIFANMHDSAVSGMTAIRSMASLPFGSSYRQIDFYLSGLVNRGVHQVGVIVNKNYHSLMDHIGTGREWDLDRKLTGISIFPPFSDAESKEVSSGRISSLSGIINYITDSNAEYVILMGCDHVANIDFEALVNEHIDSDADITMLCCDLPYNPVMVQDCVVVTPDETGRIRDIMINTAAAKGSHYSMNVLVISRKLLAELVKQASSHMKTSFERDVLAANIDTLDIRCAMHEGFVRRIYSVRSYFEADMALLDRDVRAALFTESNPIYTKRHDDPPTKYGLDCKVTNSNLGNGCVIDGIVENSILGREVRICKGAVVRNCVLFKGDVVGEGAELSCVIADKEVSISGGTKLSGNLSYPMYLSKYAHV